MMQSTSRKIYGSLMQEWQWHLCKLLMIKLSKNMVLLVYFVLPMYCIGGLVPSLHLMDAQILNVCKHISCLLMNKTSIVQGVLSIAMEILEVVPFLGGGGTLKLMKKCFQRLEELWLMFAGIALFIHFTEWRNI